MSTTKRVIVDPKKIIGDLGLKITMKTANRATAYRDKYLATREVMVEHVEKLMKDPTRIKDVAKALFDYWAPDYDEHMWEHTMAIEKLFDTASPVIAKKLFEVAEPVESGTKERIRFFDPSVGTGTVTLAFLTRMMRDIHGVDFTIFLNDISKVMTTIAAERITTKKFPSNSGKKTIFQMNKNFVKEGKNGRIPLSSEDGKVEVILMSQMLDILRGVNTKRRALKRSCWGLTEGGLMVVIGEDPSLFTVNKKTDIIVEVLFRSLFRDKGMGLNDTIREIETTEVGDYKFKVLSKILEDIDGAHNMFIVLAQKVPKRP